MSKAENGRIVTLEEAYQKGLKDARKLIKTYKSKRMKSIYKGTAIIAILFIVVSCSFSKKQAANRMETNDLPQLEIVVLDPGHFHASLLQKRN